MTSADAIAVQNATLPFVMPWKDLDPHFNVVSLDAATQGWDMLLAGQGISLRTGMDQVPKDCSVATGFDILDTLTPKALGTWASKAEQAFRPGGLLVLGGINPEHPETRKGALFPTEVAQILKESGFARVRVIQPLLTPDDASLFSALYGMSQEYAVVAQTDAYGKAFDVFSSAFAEASVSPTKERIKQAEARIKQAEAALHDRIRHDETALHDRIHRAEAALHDQSQEITELRLRLIRATRRRGLRKLVYQLKQYWRARRQAQPLPSTSADEVQLSAKPAPPVREIHIPPVDPVPLSSREDTIRTRLFGPQAE
jgi:hypothetical protein